MSASSLAQNERGWHLTIDLAVSDLLGQSPKTAVMEDETVAHQFAPVSYDRASGANT